VRYLFILFIIIMPISLMAQGLDLTGRVSFRLQNIDYDEESEIKPDSISDDEYGKSILIPGLHQYINVALFGRTNNLDLTLLADLRNNAWNKLEPRNLNSVSRFTINMRIHSNEIVLGDFFESMGESFLQSREIRGLKYALRAESAFGGDSFVDVIGVGGMVQRARSKGDHLIDLYKQYETAGQFRRWLGAGALRSGIRGTFDVGVKYLWAKETVNDPISNRVVGGDLSFYLWDRNIRFFGEYLVSEKDTVGADKFNDNAYTGGVDFSYNTIKLIFSYQKFGFQYYTAGYPFLETDRIGFRGQIGYAIPQMVTFLVDAESYDNNLDQIQYLPTTKTNVADFGITTIIPNWPEIALVIGFRKDLSDEVVNEDADLSKNDKFTSKLEGRIGFNFNSTRLSITGIYQDLDDNSLIPNSEPLGTTQFISSINFYTSTTQLFFISGGAVYSGLKMTNNQTNTNLYIYESNRWDIIPRKLSFETTITYIVNNADGGGTQDNLSNFDQINAEIFLY